MNVGVFVPSAPADHVAALQAFAEGLKACGVGHFVTGMAPRACDVAVVFGIRKDAVPLSYPRGRIIEAQCRQGRPFLVLEKGFVKRDDYFHAGWNGLNGRANFVNLESPSDRWEKLAIPLLPWRKEGEHVVICGQVPWDASVQHHDHIAWCQRTVAALGRLTDRPLRFRPHPKVAGRVDYRVRGVELSTRPLADDLDNAWAVVTFNSNCAVEAAISGVPIFASDFGSMALRVASSNIYIIENPPRMERLPWLSDLAYAQWSLGEMAAGETWLHLARGLTGAAC